MKEVFIVDQYISDITGWRFHMVCDQREVAVLEIMNEMDGYGRVVRHDDFRYSFVSETEVDDNGEPTVIASYLITPTRVVTFRDPHNKGEQS